MTSRDNDSPVPVSVRAHVHHKVSWGPLIVKLLFPHGAEKLCNYMRRCVDTNPVQIKKNCGRSLKHFIKTVPAPAPVPIVPVSGSGTGALAITRAPRGVNQESFTYVTNYRRIIPCPMVFYCAECDVSIAVYVEKSKLSNPNLALHNAHMGCFSDTRRGVIYRMCFRKYRKHMLAATLGTSDRRNDNRPPVAKNMSFNRDLPLGNWEDVLIRVAHMYIYPRHFNPQVNVIRHRIGNLAVNRYVYDNYLV